MSDPITIAEGFTVTIEIMPIRQVLDPGDGYAYALATAEAWAVTCYLDTDTDSDEAPPSWADAGWKPQQVRVLSQHGTKAEADHLVPQWAARIAAGKVPVGIVAKAWEPGHQTGQEDEPGAEPAAPDPTAPEGRNLLLSALERASHWIALAEAEGINRRCAMPDDLPHTADLVRQAILHVQAEAQARPSPQPDGAGS